MTSKKILIAWQKHALKVTSDIEKFHWVLGNFGKRRVGSSLAGDSGFATGKSHKYCDHLTQKRRKIFGKIMTNVLTQVTSYY